ncbi:hypothetical protein [Breoghania sp. L-A4]|uniref:hypothetical protein n=1 Tax=Breoghania sp. L-A4 TaxID=2304600 RepID=UPI000E35A8BD|nr:hypothetical protein [Breoghania sp. L-A4]AXS39389.1 hypothetical protein D1F64_04165 [Breoghania sp. L-A4]
MPLQNRVTPFGEIVAHEARGTLFGNRGGRIHDPRTRALSSRRWASRRWICCLLAFKGRRRAVMGTGYTELFFLDEVTALAAGHRPCFECRRRDAAAFARSWAAAQGLDAPPKADEMDRVLHDERRQDARARPLDAAAVARLPDGAMIATPTDDAAGTSFALRGPQAFPWSPDGYGAPRPRAKIASAWLLTPPVTCAALKAGFRPLWHPSGQA